MASSVAQLRSTSVSQRRREYPRVLAVLGIVIALLALGRIASNEFVEWDDAKVIVHNPRFNPPTLASVLPYALPKNAEMELYIPLTEYSWGLLAAIAYVGDADVDGSHLNPWVFHAASIAVHLLSAIVVFACLRRMLRHINVDRPTLWPAWFGAMLFAIHPLQVEAVAWASGLKDVLSGLFVISCAYCFLRFRTVTTDKRPNPYQRLWFIGTALCLLAASLSKPNAVATPLTLMAIDVVLLRNSLRRSITLLWPLFALMLPIVLITKHLQPYVLTDKAPTAIYLRPFVAGDALAFYAEKIIAPIRISFDYNRRPDQTLGTGVPYVDWLIPAAIIFLSIRAKEHRLLLGGVGVTIAALMPVLGFVTFDSQGFSTVSDHYLYPAMLGVAMIAAWLVDRFRGWWTTAAVWIAILIWTVLTSRAGDVWHDNKRLCENAVYIAPDSWNALNGLGASLEREHDYAGAEKCYRRSIELNDRNGIVHVNLAMLLIHENRPDEALLQLRKITHFYQLQSNADQSVVEMADIAIAAMMIKNRHPDLAIEACQEAIKIDPNDQRAIMMLSRARAAQALPSTLPHPPL